MLNRTSRLLCAGALVLAPALASCSTEMPTDAIYTPAAGTNARTADVDVLNAMVVSTEPGSGTLIFTLVNNRRDPVDGSESMEDRLTDVTVEGQAARMRPVRIPSASAVVVAEKTEQIPDGIGGIKVEGDFEPGEFVDVVFTFEDAGEVELEVPVLLNEEGSYVEGQDGEPAPAATDGADHGDHGDQGEESEGGADH